MRNGDTVTLEDLAKEDQVREAQRYNSKNNRRSRRW